MKKILAIAFIVIVALSGNAFAEETTFDVKVTLAQPFEIVSTTNAEFGTIYTTGKAETLTMEASTIVPKVGDDAAAAAPTMTDGKTIRAGGSPVAMTASQKAAVINVKAIEENVDLVVTLKEEASLTIPFASDPTPIKVTAITSNVSAFNSATIAANKVASLAVGPVLAIPENAKIGAYTGTVTVVVKAI